MTQIEHLSPSRMPWHEAQQRARLSSLIQSRVVRPVGGGNEAVFYYLSRCHETIARQLTADAAVYSKTQWLWYLRRLQDRFFDPDARAIHGAPYERSIAEALSALGGAESCSSLVVDHGYELNDIVSETIQRFVAGMNCLSHVNWLMRCASRGSRLVSSERSEIPEVAKSISELAAVSSGRIAGPRYGCLRAKRQYACSNDIEMSLKKVETRLLEKLQAELQKPDVTGYIVGEAMRRSRQAPSGSHERHPLTKELERERKKLQNLVRALEDGEPSSTVLTAIRTREDSVRKAGRTTRSAAADHRDAGGCRTR